MATTHVTLAEPFATRWQGKDPFVEVERLQGRVYRALEGRRTLRTEVDGRGYFVKIHHGVGWRDILKNLLTGKAPVLGAGNEWRALQRLHDAGVATMRAVAFGERGCNPARKHSFIITEELAPTVDLEVVGKAWHAVPATSKHALIAQVAATTAAMHAAGVNHRDCYLCHFLWHQDGPADVIRLSLIDLHRAQTRAHVPRRWRNKDLAALYFSALDLPLTRTQRLRFLRGYFQRELRQILQDEARLLAWLQTKAEKLRLRFERKYAGQDKPDKPAGRAA